jgi:hypothetical protein
MQMWLLNRHAPHVAATREEARGRDDAGFEAARESEAQAGRAAHATHAHTVTLGDGAGVSSASKRNLA